MSAVEMATEQMIPALPGEETAAHDPRQRPVHGIPRFELVPKRRANGEYENVEYVTILTPGDPKSAPRHKVTDEIRRKYKRHYDLFKQGLEMSNEGTPLEMFPVLTPAQINHLKSINIFTVEQLAEMADSGLHQIPMGRTMKNQAREWLEAKKDADKVESHRREIESQKDAMKMMEEQIASLSAKLETKDKGEAQREPQAAQPEPASAERGMTPAQERMARARAAKAAKRETQDTQENAGG